MEMRTDEKSAAEKDVYEAVVSLDRILEQAVPSPSSRGSIYKVPEPLRSSNPEAFTPNFISIGPYHSHRNDLMANTFKPILLRHFLHLTKHTTKTIVEKVAAFEERARGCYAEAFDMSTPEFVQLLVLDGCFVVMLLIGSRCEGFEDLAELYLWKFWDKIYYDLLLLENQLPFFLLQFLYHLFASSQPSLQGVSFIQIAHDVFIGFDEEQGLSSSQVRVHLDDIDAVDQVRVHLDDIDAVDHIVDFRKKYLTSTDSLEVWFDSTFSLATASTLRFIFHTRWPPTASMLHEYGIIFRKGKNIVFDNKGGYLALPQIDISSDFEQRMKNLLAYEQCQCNIYIDNEASNFGVFMGCLVQTDQDVKLLIDAGIIKNYLGNIKEVTQLFSNLSKNINLGINSYNDECIKMREYCKHRRHRWMTSLKRNYFSTPWLCASSIAAILLLALTLIQTVVAVQVAFKKGS